MLTTLNIIPARARVDMRIQKTLMFFLLSCVDLPISKEELMLKSKNGPPFI